MVEAGAGETYLMSFTLPAARKGEWMSGCFLEVTSRAGCAAKSSSSSEEGSSALASEQAGQVGWHLEIVASGS